MRKATFSDKSTILDLLTRSFDDNKSVNYVVKQDVNRVDRIRRLMEYSFNMCNEFGEVWISDDQQACALILFPDLKGTSVQTILWDLKLALRVIGVNRIGAILKREAMIKSNHPKEPIAYLWFIGVSQNVQGKGIGSAFLQEIVGEYERRQRPIYLETSMQRNLPFYKKFGFEIFRSLELTYTLYQLRKIFV
jgi:ribosomal protein S18 acetylase RimI-like enzyme